MTINERIKKVIKSQKRSVKIFSEEIGIPKGTLEGVVGTKKSLPSFTLLEAILKRYELLSPTWLMLGKGDMWVNDITIESSNNNDFGERINLLENYKESTEKELKELKALVGKLTKNVNTLIDLG